MEEIQGVGSIIKVLKILDYLAVEEDEIGVTALSQSLSMPKSTVIRLVTVLEKYGYVEQNPTTKKYRLGLKLFYLGTVVLKKFEIRDKALPIMHKIKEKTGESVFLNVAKDQQRMCLEVVRGIHDLQALVSVGQRSPLYAGASAKALLAFMEDAAIDEIIEKTGLTPITANTITDVNELKKELADIRKQGYAVSHSERLHGVVSVSAPVRNYSGQVVGSVAISVPEVRAEIRKIQSIISLIKDGANQISSALGWVHP